jgi:hypothetical protein
MLRADSGNAVRVELSDGDLPPCGSHIAVVGLPATDLFHLNLSQAIWKQLPGDVHPTNETPMHVSAQDLLFNERGKRMFKPRQQGHLFRLEGHVRSLPPRNDPAARMLLSCDGDIIPIDASVCPAALDGLELDCRVSVTGVCVFDVPDWSPNVVFPRIKGLTLVMRGPHDVAILSRPPWWTPAKLLVVIVSLLALLVLAASVAVSFIAERIERRYDIDTIREVQAFMEGADPDQISRERRIPKAARIALKMAAGAAAGIVIMMVLSAIMSLTMFG